MVQLFYYAFICALSLHIYITIARVVCYASCVVNESLVNNKILSI